MHTSTTTQRRGKKKRVAKFLLLCLTCNKRFIRSIGMRTIEVSCPYCREMFHDVLKRVD